MSADLQKSGFIKLDWEAGYHQQRVDQGMTDPLVIGIVLQTCRDEVWQELHVSPRLAPSTNASLCTFHRWFQPFAQAATILRLPISHTAMRQLLLFRTGCHGLAVDLGRGSGIARAKRSCALCGACPGDEMHLVFECAALQMLRDDMPTLFQGVDIACGASCGRTTWCSCPDVCVML